MARRRRGTGLAAFGCGVALAASGSVASGEQRAYELVVPQDAGVQVLNAGPARASSAVGAAWKVRRDGDAVLFMPTSSMNLGDEFGNGDTYMARRREDGWASTYVGVPGSWNTQPQAGFPPGVFEATPELALGIVASGAHPPSSPSPTQPVIAHVARDATGRLAWLLEGSALDPSSGVIPVGMSDDGTVVAFRVGPPRGSSDLPAVYARTPAGIRLVSVDQAGQPLAASEPVGRVVDRAVSPDGRRIFFFASDASGEHLFARIDGERTVQIAASPAATPIRLDGISSDGAWALLSTAAPLTADDTDSRTDLYRAGIGVGTVTLERLSRGEAPTSGNESTCGPAGVPCDAASIGLSGDGSAVYFGSPEALEPGAAAGAANLYVRRGGRTVLVAQVHADDTAALWGLPMRSFRNFGMTPDGSRMAFASKAPLKPGYDNNGHKEMYVYDHAGQSLVCASCHPSGAPPTGDLTFAAIGEPTILTADGRRVFFTSPSRLVTSDVNDALDVYEADIDRGTIGLMSSGTSPDDAAFYGASFNGRDVMFVTYDVLVPQDRNGTAFLKVYDARVGGGFRFEPPKPSCEGDDCQPEPPPGPPPAEPTTNSFGGRGNVPVLVDTSERRIAASRLSRDDLARAARTGRLRVGVRGLVAPARVTATATATLGGRRRGVGRATLLIRAGTSANVTVKLTTTFRRELRRRGRLAVRIVVRASSPRSSATVSGTLRIGRRSRGTEGGR